MLIVSWLRFVVRLNPLRCRHYTSSPEPQLDPDQENEKERTLSELPRIISVFPSATLCEVWYWVADGSPIESASCDAAPRIVRDARRP
jgi:hypothetical protein